LLYKIGYIEDCSALEDDILGHFYPVGHLSNFCLWWGWTFQIFPAGLRDAAVLNNNDIQIIKFPHCIEMLQNGQLEKLPRMEKY
jgi:hypothetical protein